MYQKELTSQQERVKKLEADLKNGSANEDGNAEFMVKQEVNTYRRSFFFSPSICCQLPSTYFLLYPATTPTLPCCP